MLWKMDVKDEWEDWRLRKRREDLVRLIRWKIEKRIEWIGEMSNVIEEEEIGDLIKRGRIEIEVDKNEVGEVKKIVEDEIWKEEIRIEREIKMRERKVEMMNDRMRKKKRIGEVLIDIGYDEMENGKIGRSVLDGLLIIDGDNRWKKGENWLMRGKWIIGRKLGGERIKKKRF